VESGSSEVSSSDGLCDKGGCDVIPGKSEGSEVSSSDGLHDMDGCDVNPVKYEGSEVSSVGLCDKGGCDVYPVKSEGSEVSSSDGLCDKDGCGVNPVKSKSEGSEVSSSEGHCDKDDPDAKVLLMREAARIMGVIEDDASLVERFAFIPVNKNRKRQWWLKNFGRELALVYVELAKLNN